MDALVSCNIGGIDVTYQPAAPCDVFYFTEPPFPLPNLNNRLKGKYIKMMTHRFLPAHDRYVWIDGNVRIINPTFWDWIPEADVVICKHPERATVFEEYDYLYKHRNSSYLKSRYSKEPWAEERKLLQKYLPEDAPLYACRFFVRRNTTHVNKAFAEWFVRTLEFCNFDQTLFTLISAGLNMKVLEYDDVFGTYLTQVEHKQVM